MIFLALAAALAASAADSPSLLRVALVERAASARLAPEGPAEIVTGGKRLSLRPGEELKLRARVGGLRLGDLALGEESRLVPGTDTLIRVGNDRHSGRLILRLDAGQTVTVIEEIDVEDYLIGVLPHEMDPGWPIEALKAQAVVARTFAYANRGKFAKHGYDLTADTRSQVFRGLTAVNERVRSAVKQTRGEVLGWSGNLLKVFYHSCCGGRTTSMEAAWGGDAKDTPKPLRGVKDSWCRLSPQFTWAAYFSWPDVAAAILERRNLSSPLSSLKIGKRDAAGFALTFLARAGREQVEVKAGELRHALGASDLRSTKISRLVARKKGVELFGAGSGHGVGLCQWGAKLQAEKGRKYEKILSFYFPDSTLSEVE